MIQDIFPLTLYNEYHSKTAGSEDTVLVFDGDRLLLSFDDASGNIRFPKARELGTDLKTVYLFRIGPASGQNKDLPDKEYYLLIPGDKDLSRSGYSFYTMKQIRAMKKSADDLIFAAYTAYHLSVWYAANRYCGACGEKTHTDDRERALVCRKCGNRIYPRINPAVIVGVINGDRMLITKYRTGYTHNALVAGFCEIGETLEQTVMREVMEETGIRVKNIRYYKSQPWGVAQDMLAGFYCEVDGDDTIRMDESELKYASWVKREDIELQPGSASLTNEMMRVFKEGRI